MTHLEELREESVDVAELIEQGEEEIRNCGDIVRGCIDDCSQCPHDKLNT